jgi:hypothetical protein
MTALARPDATTSNRPPAPLERGGVAAQLQSGLVRVPTPKVTVDPALDRGEGWWRAACKHCPYEYANCAKTDVNEKARTHRAAHRSGGIAA